MTGKLLANIFAILIFVNAILTNAATLFTDLASSYPNLGKWATISLAISAVIAPLLPRVQKIGQTINEAQRNQ